MMRTGPPQPITNVYLVPEADPKESLINRAGSITVTVIELPITLQLLL